MIYLRSDQTIEPIKMFLLQSGMKNKKGKEKIVSKL